MKNNLPITQVEKAFPKGEYLVSKTDTKGVITYANDAFVKISGFSREELVGKNHNIVRHPDMPPQAFEWLWDTLRAGYPWRGVVKNRAKNGDYYWVSAFVAPIKENEQTVGYISVRNEPGREQVRAAEALYVQLNKSGEKIKTGGGWLKGLSIRSRLMATMTFVSLMLIGGAIVGIGGVELSNQAHESTYKNRLESVDMLWKITNLMNDNRAQVMRALQHDPANEFSKMHDHPVTKHTDAIIKNRDEITALWTEYEKRGRSDESGALAKAYLAARSAYVSEGLAPARGALLTGNYRQANEILLGKVIPLYDKSYKEVISLLEQTKKDAQAEYKTSVRHYEMFRNYGVTGTIVGTLLTILSCGFLIRSISRPMEQAMRHSDHISQGDLTDEIDITGRDEAGKVLVSMSAMQANLKAMLDEVMHASRIIDQRGASLQIEMNEVASMSEMQHEQVQSVAAATEEFSQSVNEVASNSDEAASAAIESQAVVNHTHEQIDQSMQATAEVVDSVQASGNSIADLSNVIKQIGTITQSIKEIADQTNLLALNAAIEAARAGEAGRGFAVVADEVRKLADRTSKATTDIAAMVEEVKNVTDTTVKTMNVAVEVVETGMSRMHESVAGLDQILSSSERVAGMAQSIALAAKQQSMAGEDVACSMGKISGLIESNTASVQRAKLNTDELRETADNLRRVVSRFKII